MMISCLYNTEYHDVKDNDILLLCLSVIGITAFSLSTIGLPTWCVQVIRSPNLFKKSYSPQEAENAVISQRNHPVDIHIFHNAHATIAWPQQTLL